MQWIIEMWYYKLEEDNFKESAKTVLLMLLFTMFCSFLRVKMAGIQESLFMVLNLEREMKMQDREKERKGLAHSVYLIYAIMPIIYILEKVLNHLSFMVGSCFSNLLLMHGQTMNKENSTGLGYISTLSDQSSTRDYRILMYMIDMIVKMLDL